MEADYSSYSGVVPHSMSDSVSALDDGEDTNDVRTYRKYDLRQHRDHAALHLADYYSEDIRQPSPSQKGDVPN